MEKPISADRIPLRELAYFRRQFRNNIFGVIWEQFASKVEADGMTKGDIARRLGKDPSQVSRWLSEPSNLTLETISDILLALDAVPARLQCLPLGQRTAPDEESACHPLPGEAAVAPEQAPSSRIRA